MASCERCNQMTDDPALQNEVWKDIACRLREPAQGSVQRDRVREEIARTPSEPTLQGPGQGTGITANTMSEAHPSRAVPVEPKKPNRKGGFVLVSIRGLSRLRLAQAIHRTDHSSLFLRCANSGRLPNHQLQSITRVTELEHFLPQSGTHAVVLNTKHH